MTDEFDIESLFDGLPPDRAQEVARAMVEAGRRSVQGFRLSEDTIAQVRGKPANWQSSGPDFDAQEAAEIADLQQKARGQNYAIQKRNIQARYAQLRAQAAQAPEVDPEIEKIKNDPKALQKLYLSRIATLKRGDPMALRKKNQIASPFRKLGLNI